MGEDRRPGAHEGRGAGCDRLAENELQQIEPRLTDARKLAELLEEKARPERKAQLESRAKEAEQERGPPRSRPTTGGAKRPSGRSAGRRER